MDIDLLQQILTGLQQNITELTQLVNKQAQQIAQRPTTSTKSKIAKPEPFDGSAEKLDIFLRELYLNFEDDMSYFDADHMRKVRFALSYMKAKFAARWASHIIGELEAGTRTYKDWNEFRTQLLMAFKDPNKKEAAQWRLEQLKQGTRPATEFFVEFEELKSLAKYNDERYIALLKRNLSPQVVERIYTLENIPTSYEQWKSYALRFDGHLREYQALRGDSREMLRDKHLTWVQDHGKPETRIHHSSPNNLRPPLDHNPWTLIAPRTSHATTVAKRDI
jgi:Retrotransposon gag protein